MELLRDSYNATDKAKVRGVVVKDKGCRGGEGCQGC